MTQKSMVVTALEIPGLLLVEPACFGDQRGYFMETWNARRYHAEFGFPLDFVQDNVSLSQRGVLRGLHFQQPHGQGKLVSVLQGEVFDVAVDVRRGSPSFGKWLGVTLSGENKRQFYIPNGFAHGFLVTQDNTLFTYKCTDFYTPAAEVSLLWNDPALGIAWPGVAPALSAKDQAALPLASISPDRLPRYQP